MLVETLPDFTSINLPARMALGVVGLVAGSGVVWVCAKFDLEETARQANRNILEMIFNVAPTVGIENRIVGQSLRSGRRGLQR